MLGLGEKVVADHGYRGDSCVVTPDNARDGRHFNAMNAARAQHETINGRLKMWGILSEMFRHGRDKHYIAFRSVLVLEQIKIENGHPPFQVGALGDQI